MTTKLDWRLGIFLSLSCDKNNKGEKEYLSERFEGTKSGTNQHDVKITQCKDGAIYFSEQGGGDGFIYLYPEQVKHLRTILRKKP
jgi:hypothetical protein